MNEPIAIIGTACRFAGGIDSPSKLAELLHNPRDVRSRIPRSRFCVEGFHHPDGAHHGRSNVTHSYFIDQDPGTFDAPFFNINSLEAQALDPQQRMLMEIVYEALESAGQTIEGLRGSDTGVFVGVMTSDWEAMLLRDLDISPTYFAVGTSRAVLSNRISYFFGWHGASISVDTACSSSLVAVQQAVQALRAGDSHLAIACGTNLILGPENYIVESKLQMLSPDGLSRMWSKDADGYARGDGVAAILLKPLRDAIASGDPIECILREISIGQDGTTSGLTVPNASAQESLIRATYRKAGLDLARHANRPQYFEAHGTGTQRGDPIEAEAISKAFFGDSTGHVPDPSPLYVGSIKTVLGHTEGTAGIAAMLKASWALQNSIIPANLLFEELNPRVAPFYRNLEIRRTAIPWPSPQGSQPRRASVNSFGFGGTNAHAILESYASGIPTSVKPSVLPFIPFVFSASSTKTLRANLAALARFLEQNEVAVHDLAYTLQERRSMFSYRLALPSMPMNDLKEAVEAVLLDLESPVGIKALSLRQKPRIIGIFTGQGAQYTNMGRSLIQKSPFAADIIHRLNGYLSALPAEHRPIWSLYTEILADQAKSIDQAEMSQPLCTAIQIMIVDLLKLAGIAFSAVVGHSSGEIAAAYAAGHLSDRDAMCVAYYRGFCCKYATSPNGNIQGAMTAVQTSFADAQDLCLDEDFVERVTVAANNSPASITLSGDIDAIEELETVLQDEGKFYRRLKVDRAYHSAHMIPCADAYMDKLQSNSIEFLSPPPEGCKWYSSVHDGKIAGEEVALTVEYWVQNLTQPVLFAQALTAAISNDTFDIAIEVGPHPALQVPATETLENVSGSIIPYHGTLSRKQDAVKAFSTCLGFLWCHLDREMLKLPEFQTALMPYLAQACFLKNLPTYQWDHDIRYWHESRRSRQIRHRSAPYHSLLGDATPDSAPYHLTWKNVLRPQETEWLKGHQVEGKIVVPASAYISTAIEGATIMAPREKISLIEITNFQIHEAIVIDDELGVEVLIDLCRLSRPRPGLVIASFNYSAALGGDKGNLTLVASGNVAIFSDEFSVEVLHQRGPPVPHMLPVEPDRLYNFMAGLGYSFSGPFRSLVALKRKLNLARCTAKKVETHDSASLLLHPVDLDATMQSVAIAYSYPGDDRLRHRHLPTSVATIRVNPIICRQAKPSSSITIDTTCYQEDAASSRSGFSGDIEMYLHGYSHAAVQIERANFRPVMSGKVTDRNVFYKMHWIPRSPDGQRAAETVPFTSHDSRLLQMLTRIAVYYLRKFDHEVPKDSPARCQAPLCHYLNYARHITDLSTKGESRHLRQEWSHDTKEDIQNDISSMEIADSVDVKIMVLVGETMPRVFTGATSLLEPLRESDLLDEYYANGLCHRQSTVWLGQIAKQITDRHPHLNILEIGAGTGSATKTILNSVRQNLETYTFTDISSSFFERAEENLAEWHEHMIFKVLDVEKDPIPQGFVEGKYDIVVASLVLHATSVLVETLQNLRKLLKPGGYLLVAEGSSDGPLQSGAGFIFGALPGWWLGVNEGRSITPFVNSEHWDKCLKKTGFSGIDTLPPTRFSEAFGLVLFVSRAFEPRTAHLLGPLSTSDVQLKIPKIAVIGGKTPDVANVVSKLQEALRDIAGQVDFYVDIDSVDHTVLGPDTAIVSLSELDSPIFQYITAPRWYNFRKLWEVPRTMLWVTSGRIADQPFSNMLAGFVRCATHEIQESRLQLIDVPSVGNINVRSLVSELVRCHFRDDRDSNALYVWEPESIIELDGTELVPRLMGIPAANERYNSSHTPISYSINIAESVIELERHEGTHSVRELSRFESARTNSEHGDILELQMEHSVLSAIKTPTGYQFLVLGLDRQGERFIALSSVTRSVLSFPREATLPVTLNEMTASDYLLSAACHLLASSIIRPLTKGAVLLVHNCSEEIAVAISRQAASKEISVTFTADTDGALYTSVYLAPYLRRSDLQKLVSRDTACFVGLTSGGSAREAEIASMLPKGCHVETARTLYSQDGVQLGSFCQSTVHGILSEILENMSQDSQLPQRGEVELQALLDDRGPRSPLSIINWTAAEPIMARRSRLDTHHLFSSDRTYWLCGMSGALGISLCDWMIAKGVENLVITSRDPKIEPAWTELQSSNGVTVAILPCDVTDLKALKAVHRQIVETLPPIAGVVNGAMVLRDSSVATMECDELIDVINPKVLGSLNLDNIFYDVDLDFFVLLSSINCIIGNVGQANYAAANMGMVGIAANRRKRGLNSIAVNAGAIIGVGYITQSDRQLDQVVKRMSMMHLSDDDFHQIFAEAMEGGLVNSTVGPELSTGLLDIQPGNKNVPKWYSDPKFAHFIISRTAGEGEKQESDKTRSTQEQLASCKNKQEVRVLVQKAFCAQLRRILHSSTGDAELLAVRSGDLGLDSLVSVDIRRWILKTFQVDIPVLKIMASDTYVDELIQTITEELSPETLPNAMPVTRASATINPGTNDETLETVDDGNVHLQNEPLVPTSVGTESHTINGRETNVDWFVESQVPDHLVSPGSRLRNPEVPPKVIVLTGVSGLLGRHLLESLLHVSSIEKVICIAVRRLQERIHSQEIPPPHSRIEYYEGNLGADRLGLSEKEAAIIFDNCDAIIHNGSDTSHLKYYADVRDANVKSTHQILAYAIPRRIPLHYVSSAGVALLSDLDEFPEISATRAGRLPPEDGAHGYMCSKWVNERLLEDTNAQHGLPVRIYRPSTIIREGNDAKSTRAEFDWVNALIRYSHEIQTVPKVEHMTGSFDLVYVHSVCEDLLKGLSAMPLARSDEVIYVNIVGDIVIPLDQLTKIGEERGRKYQTVPLRDWAKKAITAGLHPAAATLIELFDQPGAQAFPSFSRRRE